MKIIVTDEVASPTFVSDLAEAILKLIETSHYGLYHLVNAGYCSRYDFAKKIWNSQAAASHADNPAARVAGYRHPAR